MAPRPGTDFSNTAAVLLYPSVASASRMLSHVPPQDRDAYVKPEDLHLTVSYCETAPPQRNEMMRAVRQASSSLLMPVTLHPDTVTVFPASSPEAKHAVVITYDARTDPAARDIVAFHDRLAASPHVPDTIDATHGAYRPHMTIAYAATPAEARRLAGPFLASTASTASVLGTARELLCPLEELRVGYDNTYTTLISPRDRAVFTEFSAIPIPDHARSGVLWRALSCSTYPAPRPLTRKDVAWARMQALARYASGDPTAPTTDADLLKEDHA